jgi:hypothetical protein
MKLSLILPLDKMAIRRVYVLEKKVGIIESKVTSGLTKVQCSPRQETSCSRDVRPILVDGPTSAR